jgi:hypothetical protein
VVVRNLAGAATSQVARLTVLVPPTITVQPLDQTVAQDAPVLFLSAASGSAPLSYQWRFNDAPIAGATNGSYRLAAARLADAGNYALVVTNTAGAATSRLARLTVTRPTNAAPSVTLTSPANGASFAVPTVVPIEAAASDPDGAVARVEFYAGTTLLGATARAPYGLSWTNDVVGTYTLTAVAVDNLGAAITSAPVSILVTRGASGAAVAIVRNQADPEIAAIQDALLELGLSSQVFDQAGLTAAALADFRLVIWNDAGAPGLAANDVAVFRATQDAAIPLYFIGHRLVSSAASLGTAANPWTQMLHMRAAPGASSAGLVNLDAGSFHPVVNGRFGTVGSFAVPTDVDLASETGTGEDLLGRAGSSVVLVAVELPGSAVRTVSQNFLLSRPEDSGGLAERRKLFKNSVVWLLRKGFNAFTDLSVAADPPGAPVAVGREFAVPFTVRHRGEVEGSGVNLSVSLPAGLRFVRAAFTQGSVVESDGTVTCRLGNMENAQAIALDLYFIAATAGTYLLPASVSGNEPDPSPVNNAVTVQIRAEGTGPTPPSLRLSIQSGGTVAGVLRGNAGQSYIVEYSDNLRVWQTLTTVVADGAGVAFADPGARGAGVRFYRARSN